MRRKVGTPPRFEGLRAAASRAAGAGAGAAIEHAGLPGSFAVAAFVETTAEDVLGRLLSRRQTRRVMSVANYATSWYDDFRGSGAVLRSDGFFEERDGRWSSDEIVEAVMLSAANDPSEMKLRFLGHMLASFAVDDSIDVPSAHWLLELAEDLSWQQYVQLSMVGRIGQFDVPSVEIGSRWSDVRGMSSQIQLADLGVHERNLVRGIQTNPVEPGANYVPGLEPLPIWSLDLRDQLLLSKGHVLYELLGLSHLEADVIEEELSVWRAIARLPQAE